MNDSTDGKSQVVYDHVISEAIQGCGAIAECLRERMVDDFVKYILVLLEHFCDDILLRLRLSFRWGR